MSTCRSAVPLIKGGLLLQRRQLTARLLRVDRASLAKSNHGGRGMGFENKFPRAVATPNARKIAI